ncbi:NADH-quinone oxidoreductase subunit D [Phycisphaera mikurensis]|uniref:NADH-quinone oxidoreductase subunit D n=1 Tax=Phycisphaera mikurensis (strain NBRC 102666 / KCTC 22515 / FYK2301M01) TaxID=1142394 RepID=I0IEY4_PHYMF|nr:NADH-quinone oxidoreductase subunit D [Phycisphaera mikurensis]MBB6441616.1 NADH-quinone oxidoreductase subunit D [Phycisphaera mikurensis]BAM03822.1 NADH-quinone oxidoreductase subunit D [Phycisphaera mikurensis NBRC 102666]
MPYDLKPLDVDAETTPYVDTEGWGAGGDRWALNFGPQHPATHTTLRIVMELDGERVVRAVPHIGYLHSGFEKLAEALDYNQYVTIASRMNYVSPIVNDISWHHAAEKLFDVDITPRCKAVRTILGELGRIQDHLLCVGASALDLGAFTGFIYGFNEREGIMDVMDYLAGQRFHPDWTRLGGAMADLPDEATFIKLVKRVIHELLPPAIDDLEGLLNKNRIFRDRTEGIGAVTHDEAIAWSLSGPVARASGVKRDVRKDEPYLCFADNWDGQGAEPVTFKVPLATTGDVFGRYLVRLEEIRQSIHIIEQLIDRIPGGPMNTWADGKMAKPSKSEVYGSIEGLIEHFELVMTNRKWKAPINETYACIESPNGQHGFYLVADGGPTPWRAKHRPCSFVHFAAFGKMLEGHLLADAVAILGSLNVIAAELDR